MAVSKHFSPLFFPGPPDRLLVETSVRRQQIGPLAPRCKVFEIMSPSKSSTTRAQVLVVGGGVAGLSAIHGLRSFKNPATVVLVEPRDHVEFVWGAYRALFDKATAKASLCALQPFCEKHNVQHIQSSVTELTSRQAELENGDTIEFDVCVVATGGYMEWAALGRGPPPLPSSKSNTSDIDRTTISGRLEHLRREGECLLCAKSVLICGGGLVGVEAAGDVAAYKKKENKNCDIQVALVHSGPHLCHREISASAATMVQKQLEKLGVRVVLNERAIPHENNDTQWILQNSGQVLSPDEVIRSVGMTSCNDFCKVGSRNAHGWLETDEFFRVNGTSGTIFAIGDCGTALPNNAKDILQNIHIIGHNLHQTLKAISHHDDNMDALKGLKPLALGPELYVATTGPNSGIMQSPLLHTRNFFPWFKNKTMFFFRAKMELGLKSVG